MRECRAGLKNDPTFFSVKETMDMNVSTLLATFMLQTRNGLKHKKHSISFIKITLNFKKSLKVS